MTSDQTALVISRLESIEAAQAAGFNEVRETIADVREDLGERIDKVEAQTRETNGRVRKLELWRERLAGARDVFTSIPVVLAAFASVAACLSLILPHV